MGCDTVRPVVLFAYGPDGGKKPIPFEELADLKGYRIGVTLGYFYEKTLKDAGLDVVSVAAEDQSFLMLQKGRVDLAPLGEASGWYRIKKLFPPEEVAKFHTLAKPLPSGGAVYLMTSKRYPETRNLLERFNQALAKTRERGTYRKLFERYLPDVKDIM